MPEPSDQHTAALPALGPRLDGRSAVVTGGTNGVGAELALLLRDRGADVVIVGRSDTKARAVIARSDALSATGSMTSIVADLSLMRTVDHTVARIAEQRDRIDVLVHAAGIFISHVAHSAEGLELDFATSYLSRYVFLERAADQGLIGSGTRVVSLAATAPRTPFFARVEFDDLDAVAARTGLRGHTQAQTANDLLVAAAPSRYGVAALGFGPGNVRTGILRAQPVWFRAAVGLFPKREPSEVAAQLLELLTDDAWRTDVAGWAGRSGRFGISSHVADERRQRALLAASEELHRRALAAS